jgi:rod shape-determining protein MreC
MALPDIRHRDRYLFVAVMVGHILLISSQVNSRRGIPLLQEALTTAVVETQRAAWSVVDGVRTVWGSYVALQHVHQENERLVSEIADLRIQVQREHARAHGADELRALLDLRGRFAWTTAAAEVIGGSTNPTFRSITIDRGSRAGFVSDMAVLAPAGVVGRIVQASPRASSVQLLIDQNAAVSVTVERSRAQGIAVGEGDGTLRLEYLSAVSDVQTGDPVVTAGLDGIFPKGLPVGSVAVVEKAGTAYRRVIVVPSVDFSSLEHVLVVLQRPTPEGA